MGRILSNYKKSVYDEFVYNITANVSHYYAFASNPVPFVGNTPSVTLDDYSSNFVNDWTMLFGKKLSNNDIIPVINNIQWSNGTVYSRYDNTQTDISNSNFYVITPPAIIGGDYSIYKCIDNANGSPSIYQPDQPQPTTFTKADGYSWRYITSISSSIYNKFSTSNYIPIYSNNSIVVSAANNSGVDVVVISNPGSGYETHHDGIVQSVSASQKYIQIQADASGVSNYYTNNAIYVYNNFSPTSGQLFTIVGYTSNQSGNFVYTNTAPNTSLITTGSTLYKISPAVVFETDGVVDPLAYSTVNTSSNSISSIVVINPGVNISWGNVHIQSNTNYGSGASLYCIVPPPGGHGSDPINELYMRGYCISVTFANNEGNTISTDIQYNKIGLLKNPYSLNGDGTKSSTPYSSNTFNDLLMSTTSNGTIFTVGDQVVGQSSFARGVVAFSNSTTLYLTGDKYFVNNEIVTSTSNNILSTAITINNIGSIYTRDLAPLYIQNISNVQRSVTQTESFKIVIQV